MNLILPPQKRLSITDRLNPFHVARISRITQTSPWAFDPEDSCPNGGNLQLGETFLDPPACSCGASIARLEELHSKNEPKE
jgi:hypothetical protein